MSERLVPMSLDGVELLVSVVQPPGTQPTAGRLDAVGERVVDAFGSAQAAIEAIARRVGGTVAMLAKDAVHPSGVEVAFGLSFTASGGVVVAGASAQASLTVTVKYDRSTAEGKPSPVSGGGLAGAAG